MEFRYFEVANVQGDDGNDHGTSVSGIAVARVNGTDAVGVAHRANYLPANAWFASDSNLLAANLH